jgi:TM2 domain-containing membrane protein YozV
MVTIAKIGKIGSGILALLSLIGYMGFTYFFIDGLETFYAPAAESNQLLLAGPTIAYALATVIGLALVTRALYELGRKYNKNNISIFAILGFIFYLLGTVASLMQTFNFGITSGFVWFFLSYGSYLVSLNSAGRESKVGFFKYSGYVLFLSVLSVPMAIIITVFAFLFAIQPLIGFAAWLLSYLAFNKLGESKQIAHLRKETKTIS